MHIYKMLFYFFGSYISYEKMTKTQKVHGSHAIDQVHDLCSLVQH